MRSLILVVSFVALALSTTAQMYSSRVWEVTHPDIKYTSYLVGTVHSGDETLFDINDSLYWALEQCDRVAFEVVEEEDENIFSGTWTKMAAANRDIGFLTMECIMDLLPKYEHLEMDTLVNRYLNGIKGLYGSNVRTARGDAYRSMVFDDFLTSYARFKGKEVDGIEDVQFQIKTLYSFTKPQMLSVVSGYFDMKPNVFSTVSDDSVVRMAAENRYSNMCNRYSGLSQDAVWGSYFIKLLDNRNIQMADYVIEHSKEEPMMCAVGLGHMCGPMGVISLLQKEGYTIRPISIYNKFKRNKELRWYEYENNDFKTVLPRGVDSIIKKFDYGSGLAGFMSGQNSKTKNVLMTPEGAVWFEYQGGSYEDDYDSYLIDEEIGDDETSDGLEKKMQAYAYGNDDNEDSEDAAEEVAGDYAIEEVVEAAAEATVEALGESEEVEEEMEPEVVDGKTLTDSLVNSVIDSITNFVLGDVDNTDEDEKKEYPSRFVEFWSKVSESRTENVLGMMMNKDTADTEPKIDTISLGEGFGTYTATYADDVIFEYEIPDDDSIILRIRGDEKAMRRPDLLDYFRKAVLKEKE